MTTATLVFKSQSSLQFPSTGHTVSTGVEYVHVSYIAIQFTEACRHSRKHVMNVSFLIPVYSEVESLQSTLSILDDTCQPHIHEIILLVHKESIPR